MSIRTNTQVSIRKRNLYRIWDMIAENPGVTRQELARGSGLSLMTVTNLVDILEECGALSFASPEYALSAKEGGARRAGRKADRISLDAQGHAWLALDLTDEHFRFTALTLGAAVLETSDSWEYDRAVSYEDNLRAFLGKTRDYIHARLKKRTVIGVAVIVPGPYDVEGDRVNNQRIPALNQLRVKALLLETLGAYAYYVDEDVKFAVRAYLCEARGDERLPLYYLFIGEGVGGAALLEGSVLRGLNAVAGDCGQLRRGDGTTCESALSLRAFMARIGGMPAASMGRQELLSLAAGVARRSADAYARSLTDVAEIIARMLYEVVWILDPAKVIVDCLYAPPMEAFLLEKVREALARALGGAVNAPEILPARRDMPDVIRGASPVICHAWLESRVDAG